MDGWLRSPAISSRVAVPDTNTSPFRHEARIGKCLTTTKIRLPLGDAGCVEMSYWKDVQFRRWEGLPDDPEDEVEAGDLQSYAALLGGEVDGDCICAPVRDGRPMIVAALSASMGRATCSSIAAKDRRRECSLRRRLKLAPAPRSTDNGSFALRLLAELVPAPTTLVETYLGIRALTGSIRPACTSMASACTNPLASIVPLWWPKEARLMAPSSLYTEHTCGVMAAAKPM